MKDKEKGHGKHGGKHQKDEELQQQDEAMYEGYYWPENINATCTEIDGVTIAPTSLNALATAHPSFYKGISSAPSPKPTLCAPADHLLKINGVNQRGVQIIGGTIPPR